MTKKDIKWAEDWYSRIHNKWLNHVDWCVVNNIIAKPYKEFLLEHIVSDLLSHKKTRIRNRRMRYVIVARWKSLEACVIVQELDLNVLEK